MNTHSNGSIVGAGLIVCGLYMVLWGKTREIKNKTQLMPSQECELIDINVNAAEPNTQFKASNSAIDDGESLEKE